MITVNGDPLEHEEGLTVQGILEAKNYKFPLLIAFVNGKLVKREDYRTTVVPDGAVVQITHLMGGG